jgi:hypothetical protein
MIGNQMDTENQEKYESCQSCCKTEVYKQANDLDIGYFCDDCLDRDKSEF